MELINLSGKFSLELLQTGALRNTHYFGHGEFGVRSLQSVSPIVY